MKILRNVGAVLFAAALFLSLGAASAAAQGQAGTSPSNAPYIDNQSHTLDANSSAWYRFDYTINSTLGRMPVTIRLVNGNKAGLAFQVWTPEGVTDTTNNKPIGVGASYPVDCNTGQRSATGSCESSDLVWTGAFGASGTYYVLVMNDNSSATGALLTIQGPEVGLGAQPSSAPSAVAQAPAISSNTDDPGKATTIDNQAHSIPADSVAWYSFDYSVSASSGRPVITLRLVNGYAAGLTFQVWSPNELNNWWDNKPVGAGTTYNVDCDTGVRTAASTCKSPDLTWTGTFGESGTYYVRVINNTSNALNADLTIQ